MAEKNDDLQERLDRHLAKVAEAKRQAEEEATRKREAPKRFADTFHAICAAKIVPTLEEARTPFVKQGLESSVVKKYNEDPPLILLEVELRGSSVLIYTAFKETSDIRVSRAYNYYSGSGDEIGRFGLNDITPEIVQSQVNEFLEVGMK